MGGGGGGWRKTRDRGRERGDLVSPLAAREEEEEEEEERERRRRMRSVAVCK